MKVPVRPRQVFAFSGILDIPPGEKGNPAFLEHSRVFHFVGSDEHWIGSSDMMHRNLDRRVEVQVRVADRRLTAQLDAIFDSALDPATRCWVLGPDGEWHASPEDGSSVRDHQAQLLATHRAVG